MREHRSILLGLLLLLPSLALALPPAPTASAAPVADDAIALRLGQRAFWSGYVESGGWSAQNAFQEHACQGDAANHFACPIVDFPPGALVGGDVCRLEGWCVEYGIDVLEAGGTLRVALDHPSLHDKFDLWITKPGELLGARHGSGAMSMEGRIPDAPTGRYLVQAIFYDVQESPFRMRAYLEPPAGPADETARLLLPNLRMVPPFHLGFTGCQPTEVVSYGAQRCLRFGTGPANVGRGLLDLRIREVALEGPEVQRIHASDGTWIEVPAGEFEYHAEHAHYHHKAMNGVELWRVADETAGTLELAARGPKIGFCMVDIMLFEWRSLRQDAQFSGAGTCSDTTDAFAAPGAPTLRDAPTFGLTVGWADIYDYWVEGNFVEVASVPDGLYVLRVAADPDGIVTESDEADNVAYALVRITGDVVDVLERGQGASPWDPEKALADDLLRGTI